MKPENFFGLGHTRSDRQLTHLLHTPDAFVRIPLPGAEGSEFVVHAAPALGAKFAWMTVYSDANAKLAPSTVQRFLYVLEGRYEVSGIKKNRTLLPGSYAYLPANSSAILRATKKSVAVLIEKEYIPTSERPPAAPVFGTESRVASTPLMGDEDLQVKGLMPTASKYDFAVNTMTYQPGAALSMVEVHVMEHGLLMLEGAGIYKLGNQWYPVAKGDFIWMAPYCPQWFCAVGKRPAKYLIYKDWNRPALGNK